MSEAQEVRDFSLSEVHKEIRAILVAASRKGLTSQQLINEYSKVNRVPLTDHMRQFGCFGVDSFLTQHCSSVTTQSGGLWFPVLHADNPVHMELMERNARIEARFEARQQAKRAEAGPANRPTQLKTKKTNQAVTYEQFEEAILEFLVMEKTSHWMCKGEDVGKLNNYIQSRFKCEGVPRKELLSMLVGPRVVYSEQHKLISLANTTSADWSFPVKIEPNNNNNGGSSLPSLLFMNNSMLADPYSAQIDAVNNAVPLNLDQEGNPACSCQCQSVLLPIIQRMERGIRRLENNMNDQCCSLESSDDVIGTTSMSTTERFMAVESQANSL